MYAVTSDVCSIMNVTIVAMGCGVVQVPDLAVSMNQHYTSNKYILLSTNNIYHAPHHIYITAFRRLGIVPSAAHLLLINLF
jgi:hypothetical protein